LNCDTLLFVLSTRNSNPTQTIATEYAQVKNACDNNVITVGATKYVNV